MTYLKKLRSRADGVGNIICVGLDPVADKIPGGVSGIAPYFIRMLDGLAGEGCVPACVKPNTAFYEQYGFDGLHALRDVISYAQTIGIPVILDAKRGDVGKTSVAYATACFDFWGADAATVAPYMGSDSLLPFFEHCARGKGVYVLVRTSNAGAHDFQDLPVGCEKLYERVASLLVSRHVLGVGAVVGATQPAEFEALSRFFVCSGKEVPFLIPGVGSQGGSAAQIASVLKHTGNELAIHRINSSSGITYAHEKEKNTDYVGAAVREFKKLRKEIGFTG